MYIPTAFAETHIEVLHAFIRQNSFGTLVTVAPEGLIATHLPFLLQESGGSAGVLLGHMARPNPQWQTLASGAEAMAIFQGPHAYISPRWYQTQRVVPTWNYMAVHAYGRGRIIEDPKQVRLLLDATVATYEPAGPEGWRTDKLPEEYLAGMARGIVAFAIELTRIEGKFKLNQNRPAEDRAGVVRALSNAPTDTERAVAAAMLKTGGDAK